MDLAPYSRGIVTRWSYHGRALRAVEPSRSRVEEDRSMESIQLFVPTFRIEETLAQIRECLEKGWTGLGYKTLEFEEAWRRYTGLPHAHFLNSATAGLHLAVRLLKERYGWTDGDEVISTPLTFVST